MLCDNTLWVEHFTHSSASCGAILSLDIDEDVDGS